MFMNHLFHEKEDLITPAFNIAVNFLHLHLDKSLDCLWTFNDAEAERIYAYEPDMFSYPIKTILCTWTTKCLDPSTSLLFLLELRPRI